MKTIYILCLAGVRTGGPEALHQLSDALLEQGFPARMVYYTWEEVAALERASPGAGYSFGFRGNEVTDYDRYQKRPVSAVPNDDNSVIVLPEPLCHLAPLFNRSTVLIWWLSVDNGFGALSKVNLNHLHAENVWHAAQSQYAERFLEALNLPFGGMLSDYTADLSKLVAPQPWFERKKIIVFNENPHKVTASFDAFSDKIREIDPDILVVKAQGTRDQMASLFASAQVYVDLGSMPGKDRMPREALSMGCFVVLGPRQRGAGSDFPYYMRSASNDFPYYIHCASDDLSIVAARASALIGCELQSKGGSLADTEREVFFAEAFEVFASLAGVPDSALEEGVGIA